MAGWFGRTFGRALGQKPTDEQREQRAPLVVFTPAAREQLGSVLASQAPGTALRILAKPAGPGGVAYDMALEPPTATRPTDDVRLDVGGLPVVVDAQSVQLVDGATVDFVADPLRPGFRVDPPPAGGGDDDNPLAAEVRRVLEEQINPGIAAHGGRASLVGVEDDVAYVALGGGCQGCSMASVTLKQGIEQLLKAAIPRLRAVVDVTDHAGGNNPFYTSAKGGGQSPFHQASKA